MFGDCAGLDSTIIYCSCTSHSYCSQFSSVQSLSRVWLFATPWIAAHQASLSNQLPEFTQTHVHRVGDAIQPPHPLSSPSPPDPNPSQHQSLFQWVNSSHELAKVLEFQHQFFQRTPRTDLLSSPTPQFKSINSSVLSFLHSPTLTSIHDYWKNHSFDKMYVCCVVWGDISL